MCNSARKIANIYTDEYWHMTRTELGEMHSERQMNHKQWFTRTILKQDLAIVIMRAHAYTVQENSI